jgi:hypothetical protein
MLIYAFLADDLRVLEVCRAAFHERAGLSCSVAGL